LNDENIGEISSDGDSIFDNYIQLVTSETHAISDCESDNGSDEQEEHMNTELGGVSKKLVWQNIGSFPVSQKNVLMCMILSSTLLNSVS
jgi:hypothetical protein